MSYPAKEEITDVIEYLKQEGSTPITLPIRSIDGIVCGGYFDMSKGCTCRSHEGSTQTPNLVRIKLFARYKGKDLFSKYFDADATHQDVMDFIKTLPDLKYCNINQSLCHDKTDHPYYYERKLMHDLFSSIENDNYRPDFGECPVCLESTYNKLQCGHHICLQCESKLKECKCPQCRERYARCQCNDDDCECDFN
jgi:hypothetical protein